MMKSIRKTLSILFAVPIFLSLIIVLLYECDLLISGEMERDAVLEYQLVGTMELITICLIPLALRLFKFKFVHRQIIDDSVKGMKKWGILRIAMIAIPMLVNTFLYYQFVNVAFGYMGIIGLLSLVFVYPSEERCRREMGDEA
ncbi:hypothetical protein [Hallella bergensis]|uniref:hypothetical protein n=1 Tax=Hallella bergensis TaxID=242750 RepID=UPI0039908B85